MSSRFYFPGMTDAVTRYCSGCLACQLNKAANKKAGLTQITEFNHKRWAQQSMDFIVGLPKAKGFDSIYVVCDRGCSKMVHLVACKSTNTAEQVAQLYLDTVYKLHGLPQQIISDRDAKFMSNWYRAFMQKLGVKNTPSSVYHPQTDGQTENANKIIKFYLRLICQKNPYDWHLFLPVVEFCINSHKNASTDQSPFELMYGEQPVQLKEQLLGISSSVPACDDWAKVFRKKIDSAQECLRQAAAYYKKQHDKHRKDLALVPGDMVLLSTEKLKLPLPGGKVKLKSPYTGPLKVKAIKGSGVSIELEVPSSWHANATWHISYIKKYVPFQWENEELVHDEFMPPEQLLPGDDLGVLHDEQHGVEQPVYDNGGDALGQPEMGTAVPQEVELLDGQPQWVVERILDLREKKGERKYKVTFKDRPRSEDCWVLEAEAAQKYAGWEAALSAFRDKPAASRGLRANARRVSFASTVQVYGVAKPRMRAADLFSWHKCDW